MLFGARGDLSKRKLLPGLYRLMLGGLLPDDFRIVGTGRHAPDGDFVDEARAALEEHAADDLEDDAWERFAKTLDFVTSDADDSEELVNAVGAARKDLGDESRTLLYLSVPPSATLGIVKMLADSGLSTDPRARLVMEKPFGSDLESAKELNAVLHEHVDEDVIYRTDHFLSKEGAQDILALRFANSLFEPIWNRHHIASVQIDVPEDLGLEGRAGFYEETGAFRDMIVTHLGQLLGFVAMEPPKSLDAGALRDAKAAVLADLQPFDPATVVRGQYEGYQEEDGVDDESTTETFVALRASIANDRWRGVPFLLRTGKALAEGRRVITLQLRPAEHQLFDTADAEPAAPNALVLELTDAPKLRAEVQVKVPGPTSLIAPAGLTLDVERALDADGLEAYERLLHDAMVGDHLLFTRADEVERLWACAAPVLENPPELHPYAKGSWGPDAAIDLAEPAGWRLPDHDTHD